MEKRTSVLITFALVIVMIAGLYIFTDWFSQVTGYFLGEGEIKKIAFCLNENGAEFYGSSYCPDCEKTRKLFGQSFKSIHYIDCGKEMENCPNIQSIPAWFIKKKIYYGFKDITELKELGACEYTSFS